MTQELLSSRSKQSSSTFISRGSWGCGGALVVFRVSGAGIWKPQNTILKVLKEVIIFLLWNTLPFPHCSALSVFCDRTLSFYTYEFAFQSHGRNNKTTPAITRFHACTWACWHTLSLSVLWRPRQGDLSSRKDPVQWYDPISKSVKKNNNNKKNMYATCPPSLIYVPFT